VAIADPALDRVIFLTSSGGRELDAHEITVGEGIATTAAATDRKRLFVLSRGKEPRTKTTDEPARLTVIDGSADTGPKIVHQYNLSQPDQGIALDPSGRWVVLYDSEGTLVNPNELIFVDLDSSSDETVSRTLRSFGGQPQRFTFTTELGLPKGPGRLLLVETERDVAILDLDPDALKDPNNQEVTLGMPDAVSGGLATPAGLAYDDGDPTDVEDTRIAVRLSNDSSVLFYKIEADPVKKYRLVPNTADVDGLPTDIAFVRTGTADGDPGLRLAAMVPSQRSAKLVDPELSLVEAVALPRAYQHLTRITGEAVSNGPDEVALLWSSSTQGIAFWSLQKTVDTPFRSVDDYDIALMVGNVLDVPGAKYSNLKILQGAASDDEFFVLDLDKRQSFPMLTRASGYSLYVAPTGERAWAYQPGDPRFASMRFSDLHPVSLELQRDVSAVFEVEQKDGGFAAVALHMGDGALGATVLDAVDPDTADTRFYSELWLGGLR
jgi:hypothetical protein